MSRKFASLVRMEDQVVHNWDWTGISQADTEKEAMIGVAVSVGGYDEDYLTGDGILAKFYNDGWRARLLELKSDEDGDKLETRIEDLI